MSSRPCCCSGRRERFRRKIGQSIPISSSEAAADQRLPRLLASAMSPYQPVAEVLLRSGRVGGNGHDQDGKRVARRGDKDDRGGLLGADETETGQCSRTRLSWG